MPSRRNALKQVRKDKKLNARNTYVKATLKTARKKFEGVLKEGNKEKLGEAYKSLVTIVDKTVKKGIIPAGRGSRIKSRYALKTNALVAAKQ